MEGSNRAVTSREYKLMLNVHRFMDRAEGSTAFWSVVESMAKKHGGVIVGVNDPF